MSITTPQGFRAAGIAAGIKSNGNPDLALVVNDGPAPASAVVFTSNRAKANPILWSQWAHEQTVPRAIVLNSGGANCFTGTFGYDTSRLTAERAAAELDLRAEEVLVCSTGLIGVGDERFRTCVLDGVSHAVTKLSTTDTDAPEAILTTDTVAKTAVRQSSDGWSIGAMAKGAGMLAPGLATMLVVVTTDALISDEAADRALREAVRVSFNRLDSDGCMSTNDQVTLLASGSSGRVADEAEFTRLLTDVCDDLAGQLQSDAEGASHDIDIEVVHAESELHAEEVARSVARNNLFKAAIFGNDPNWGRVLAAIGTTNASFDPFDVDVSFNGVRLCSKGAPDRPVDECDLTPRRTHVLIDLRAGSATATIRTNDLTHAYVHENSAYSS